MGLGLIATDIGADKTEAEAAWYRWDHDFRNIEFFRWRNGMKRARTAEHSANSRGSWPRSTDTTPNSSAILLFNRNNPRRGRDVCRGGRNFFERANGAVVIDGHPASRSDPASRYPKTRLASVTVAPFRRP